MSRAALVAFAALAMAGCTRAASSDPPRPDATCARLADLYAKEKLPYERGECVRMMTALSPSDAACFDRCTQGATVKALIACEADCRKTQP